VTAGDHEEWTMHNLRIPQHLSPKAFALLGLQEFAYVKRVTIDGAPAYAIHAADGTHLGQASDRAEASAALREYDLLAVSVH
jgi:hypothetical protein